MTRHLTWDPATEHFTPRAALDRTPAYFEAELGLTFTSSFDGLDYFEAALMESDSGMRFLLKQYRGARPNTTTIYFAPKQQDVDSITETVHEIVSGLGLTSRDILWERKDNPEA